MARPLSLIFSLMLAFSLSFSLSSSTAQGKGAGDASGAASCSDPAGATTFQSSSGTTQVTVCPSVVVSGHRVRIVVHTRRFTQVRLQIQYPDGTTDSPPGMRSDGQGQAAFDVTVRYNPINRYVLAPFVVMVGRGGQLETVRGTVNIAQGVPLGNSRLRAREAAAGGIDNGAIWCPGDPAACMVHNNTQIVIRIDTDPGAQVSVALVYPDNQSTPCTGNELTGGSTFASDTGIYRCELPVVFQARGKHRTTTLTVTAQVSSGSYSKPLSQKLYLVSN
jgi:hypothetical protein